MAYSRVVSHFTRIASSYDELYSFVYKPVAKFAVRYLQLQPDDLLADVGAGTGRTSHLIWKETGNFIFTLDIATRINSTIYDFHG